MRADCTITFLFLTSQIRKVLVRIKIVEILLRRHFAHSFLAALLKLQQIKLRRFRSQRRRLLLPDPDCGAFVVRLLENCVFAEKALRSVRLPLLFHGLLELTVLLQTLSKRWLSRVLPIFEVQHISFTEVWYFDIAVTLSGRTVNASGGIRRVEI